MNPNGSPVLPENDQVKWNWKNVVKGVLYFFGIIILSFVVIIAIVYYGDKYRLAKHQENYEKLVEENNRLIAEFEQKSKEDTFGGKTPEETLDLLIVALKNNDIDLAVKYFSIDTQEKAKEKLKNELAKEGNFNSRVDYYLKVVKGGMKACDDDSCGFEYRYVTEEDGYVYFDENNPAVLIPKGSAQRNYVQFVKNIYKELWKIVEF